MAEGVIVCPKCGATVPEEALVCPECHALLEGPAVPPGGAARGDPPASAPPPPTEEPPRKSARPPRATRGSGAEVPNPFAAELSRRLARLRQWSDGTQALGAALPRLPEWAEEMARTSTNPEPWAEVVRGIERLAQKRIVTTFEDWE